MTRACQCFLVGHSSGGFNIRLFASQYPNHVVGLVLVDSSHEDEYGRIAALLSPEAKEEYLRHEGGENLERLDLLTSAAQIRNSARLKEMPIIVLSAPGNADPLTGWPQGAQVHNELQAGLARQLSGSTHIIAEKNGHYVQLDGPDLATNAVLKIVEAARQMSSIR